MNTIAERMLATAGIEMVVRRKTNEGSPTVTAGVLAHTGSELQSAAAMAVKKDWLVDQLNGAAAASAALSAAPTPTRQLYAEPGCSTPGGTVTVWFAPFCSGTV